MKRQLADIEQLLDRAEAVEDEVLQLKTQAAGRNSREDEQVRAPTCVRSMPLLHTHFEAGED